MPGENALSVKVRMYRQGLGDCFLLTFVQGDNRFHMLIDCGVLLGTEKAGDTMKRIVQNIHDTTNGHLDLVIVTHEHWDHVSGFIQAQDIFKKFEIDCVWFAWTEDPIDKDAKRIREHRQNVQLQLQKTLQYCKQNKIDTPTIAGVSELFNFISDPLAAKGNTSNTAVAMTSIAALGKRVEYLSPGKEPLPLPGLDGVQIYVLGPPRDTKLLFKSDPTKSGKEVYELTSFSPFTLEDSWFAAVEPKDAEEMVNGDIKAWSMPFDPQIPGHSLQEASKRAAVKAMHSLYADHKNAWRRIDDDWLSLAGEFALKLDADTNNTSLALAIELSEKGKVLLFPADAQVGNWLSWQDLSWKIRRPDRRNPIRVDVNDLLGRTVLYKVGHHGSHNATLREFGLERMTNTDLIALIPVNKAMAAKKRWRMPFKPLLERLQEKTQGRVLQADDGLSAFNGSHPPALKRFIEDIESHDDYVELTIDAD